MYIMFSYSCTCIYILYTMIIFTGTDFTSDPFTVRISAGMTKFVLPDNFLVDDDVNEIEQDFALIGELGTDVPDSFACFQRRMGDERGCIAGRTGATTIQIIDNDR